MNPYLELAKRWEGIAAKMEKNGVTTMTANTHRLFANELKAVIRTQHAAGVAWGDAFPCTYMVHGDKASIEQVVKMLNNQ